MKIKNLTPHPINIVDEDNNIIKTFPKPEGLIPRIQQSNENTGEIIDGITITKAVYGDTENLPEFQKGQYYIVSRMVISGNPLRIDLLAPNELVRDKDGRIIGAKSLSR